MLLLDVFFLHCSLHQQTHKSSVTGNMISRYFKGCKFFVMRQQLSFVKVHPRFSATTVNGTGQMVLAMVEDNQSFLLDM